MTDMVNHPPHYQSESGIECIDAIVAALDRQSAIAYCKGAVIKYMWRSDKKGCSVQDMQKAAWYANKAAELEAGEEPMIVTGVKCL